MVCLRRRIKDPAQADHCELPVIIAGRRERIRIMRKENVAGQSKTTKERDYLFDNVKAVMLFLVALGHVINVYMKDGAVELTLIKYIYLFHMPVFAFVTGYFSKDADRAREKAMTGSLFPYILFQGIYVLMAQTMIVLGLASFNTDIFNGSILLPSSAFYYLLAVFFWKLFQKDLFRFRHPLVLSLLLGLLVSLTGQEAFHTGYGAVFSLLIFFTAGVMCDAEMIGRIRELPRWIGAVILLAGIPAAFFTPYTMHSVRLTYAAEGFSNPQGLLMRILFYVIAFLMGAAIIQLMPAGKTWISGIGKASLIVYAGSTFLSPHAYLLLASALHLRSNRALNLLGMIVFCALLVAFCSLPIFSRLYDLIMNGIRTVLLVPGDSGGNAGQNSLRKEGSRRERAGKDANRKR